MNAVYMDTLCNLMYGGTRDDAKAIAGNTYPGDTMQSSSLAYFYGSTIKQLAKDHVIFENPMMPSGAKYFRWDMIFSYVSAHETPKLPLLAHGHRYRVHLVAKTNREAGVFIRLLFFDTNSELITMKIFKDQEGTFTYPDNAYFYAVELVNAGASQLDFHRLDIMEVVDDEEMSAEEEEAAYQQTLVEKEQAVATINHYLSEED